MAANQLDTFSKEILGQLDSLYNSAITAATTTVAMGDGLMGYFLGILIVWKGLEFAFVDRDKGEIMFEFIKVIILWGVAKWFLVQYGFLVKELLDGFTLISTTIKNALVTSGGTGTYMQELSKLIVKLEHIKSTISLMQGVGITDIAKAMSYVLAYIHLWLATIIVALFAVAFQAVAILMLSVVKIYTIIGVLAGPIMIPFMLFIPLQWIAEGWIKYMITVGFMTVVVNLLLAMADKLGGNYILEITKKIDASIVANGYGGAAAFSSEQARAMALAVDLWQLLVLAATFIIMGFVILQTPAIAEMLLSGRGMGMGVSGASASANNKAGKGVGSLSKKGK